MTEFTLYNGNKIKLPDYTDVADVKIIDNDLQLLGAALNTTHTTATTASSKADSATTKAENAYSKASTHDNKITEISGRMDTVESEVSTIGTLSDELDDEISAREEADTDLQEQIDAIVSKSDVVDVVSCYDRETDITKSDIVHYNTAKLGNNDVVKVLVDETHSNERSYYRWIITSGTGSWNYIGSEGSFYTKAESDAMLLLKQDITDNTLKTESKTIIGAINEIYDTGGGSKTGGVEKVNNLPALTSDNEGKAIWYLTRKVGTNEIGYYGIMKDMTQSGTYQWVKQNDISVYQATTNFPTATEKLYNDGKICYSIDDNDLYKVKKIIIMPSISYYWENYLISSMLTPSATLPEATSDDLNKYIYNTTDSKVYQCQLVYPLKYVYFGDASKITVTTVTIPTTEWTTVSDGTTNYYTKEIDCTGILPSSVCQRDYVRPDPMVVATNELYMEMYMLITRVVPETDKILVYASAVPTTQFDMYIVFMKPGSNSGDGVSIDNYDATATITSTAALVKEATFPQGTDISGIVFPEGTNIYFYDVTS